MVCSWYVLTNMVCCQTNEISVRVEVNNCSIVPGGRGFEFIHALSLLTLWLRYRKGLFFRRQPRQSLYSHPSERAVGKAIAYPELLTVPPDQPGRSNFLQLVYQTARTPSTDNAEGFLARKRYPNSIPAGWATTVSGYEASIWWGVSEVEETHPNMTVKLRECSMYPSLSKKHRETSKNNKTRAKLDVHRHWTDVETLVSISTPWSLLQNDSLRRRSRGGFRAWEGWRWCHIAPAEGMATIRFGV